MKQQAARANEVFWQLWKREGRPIKKTDCLKYCRPCSCFGSLCGGCVHSVLSQSWRLIMSPLSGHKLSLSQRHRHHHHHQIIFKYWKGHKEQIINLLNKSSWHSVWTSCHRRSAAPRCWRHVFVFFVWLGKATCLCLCLFLFGFFYWLVKAGHLSLSFLFGFFYWLGKATWPGGRIGRKLQRKKRN